MSLLKQAIQKTAAIRTAEPPPISDIELKLIDVTCGKIATEAASLITASSRLEAMSSIGTLMEDNELTDTTVTMAGIALNEIYSELGVVGDEPIEITVESIESFFTVIWDAIMAVLKHIIEAVVTVFNYLDDKIPIVGNSAKKIAEEAAALEKSGAVLQNRTFTDPSIVNGLTGFLADNNAKTLTIALVNKALSFSGSVGNSDDLSKFKDNLSNIKSAADSAMAKYPDKIFAEAYPLNKKLDKITTAEIADKSVKQYTTKFISGFAANGIVAVIEERNKPSSYAEYYTYIKAGVPKTDVEAMLAIPTVRIVSFTFDKNNVDPNLDIVTPTLGEMITLAKDIKTESDYTRSGVIKTKAVLTGFSKVFKQLSDRLSNSSTTADRYGNKLMSLTINRADVALISSHTTAITTASFNVLKTSLLLLRYSKKCLEQYKPS